MSISGKAEKQEVIFKNQKNFEKNGKNRKRLGLLAAVLLIEFMLLAHH